jgi:hypothetical protein
LHIPEEQPANNETDAAAQVETEVTGISFTFAYATFCLQGEKVTRCAYTFVGKLLLLLPVGKTWEHPMIGHWGTDFQ